MGNKFRTKGIIHSSMFLYVTSPQGRFPMKPFNLLFSLHPRQKQTLTDAAPRGGVSPRRAPQLLQGQGCEKSRLKGFIGNLPWGEVTYRNMEL